MKERKAYYVFSYFGQLLGTVSAFNKAHALFLAERDLKAEPGCYVGPV